MPHFFATRALAADTIALADAAADAATDAMKLRIRSICGNKSTTITVEPSDSVRTVKAKILNGCTPDWNLSTCMRMLYGCEILDETLPLAHYNILSGSTVFTLRKCRVRECPHERRHVPSSHTARESTSQLAKSITTTSVDATLAATTADAEDPVMGVEDVDDLDAMEVEAGDAVEVGAKAEGTTAVATTNVESTSVASAIFEPEYAPEDDATPRAAKRGRMQEACAEASSREADGTDMANTEPHEVALPSYYLGADVTRTDTGTDPSSIVGKTVIVPNRLWGSRLKGATRCNVSGFIGPYKFGKSGKKQAYVIQAMDDGLFYPVAAEYLTKIMPRKAAQTPRPATATGPPPTGRNHRHAAGSEASLATTRPPPYHRQPARHLATAHRPPASRQPPASRRHRLAAIHHHPPAPSATICQSRLRLPGCNGDRNRPPARRSSANTQHNLA